MSRGVIVAVGFLCYAAEMANAGPVTWEFSGIVTSMRDDLGLLHDASNGAVGLGSALHGFVTLESTTQEINPGDYVFAVTSITGNLSTIPFSLASSDSETLNRTRIAEGSTDYYSVTVPLQFLSFPAPYLVIFASDSTGTMLSSGDLVLTPPNPELFPTYFRLNELDGAFGMYLNGIIQNMHIIPEPATLIMLGFGLAVGCRQKRNRMRYP